MNQGEIQQRVQGKATGVLRPDSRAYDGERLERRPAQKGEHGRKAWMRDSCRSEHTG